MLGVISSSNKSIQCIGLSGKGQYIQYFYILIMFVNFNIF